MKRNVRRATGAALSALGLLAAGSGFGAAAAPKANDDVSVSQVSNDPHVSAGEGYVMPDPTSPGRVTVTWLATSNFGSDPTNVTYGYCGTAWSDDDGHTWKDVQALPQEAVMAGGERLRVESTRKTTVTCGDPVGGVGPDGTVYAGAAAIGSPSYEQAFTSFDHGSHWNRSVEMFGANQSLAAIQDPNNYAAGNAKTPPAGPGRAFMAVDPVTGAISVQSQEDGGAEGRWLVVSHDRGATWTAPHPLDPDVQGRSAGPHSAARGVVALTYTVDPTSPTYLSAPKPAVACAASCLVFATSSDDGVTWQRHVIEGAPGTASTKFTAADPNEPGHFAVLLTNGSGNAGPGGGGRTLEAWRTEDGGATWVHDVVATAADGHTFNKAGFGFAPDGTLAAVWRDQGADGSYDVWAAVSDDGGSTWRPRKLTATPAPGSTTPTPGDDCSCNIGVTNTSVYTVWGDARGGNRELWFGAWRFAGKS
jgi:hypothetical protein